jgi:hypothetical protein
VKNFTLKEHLRSYPAERNKENKDGKGIKKRAKLI